MAALRQCLRAAGRRVFLVTIVLSMAAPVHAGGRTYHITRLNRGPMGFAVTGHYDPDRLAYTLRFPTQVARRSGGMGTFTQATMDVGEPALQVAVSTEPTQDGREWRLTLAPTLLPKARLRLEYRYADSGDQEAYWIGLAEIAGPEADRALINPHPARD